MRAVLDAIVPAIRTDLADHVPPCPLYTKQRGRGGLNEHSAGPPYALFLPVTRPQSRLGEWESLLGFELHVWAAYFQLATIAEDIVWLEGYKAGSQGDARQIIVYSAGPAQLNVEPEVTTPTGEDLWHLRDPYRISYGSTAKLAAMAGVGP